MQFKLMMTTVNFQLTGYSIFAGEKNQERLMVSFYWCKTSLHLLLQVIEKSIEVGADDSQFPSNWIYHSREKKPGKAFVDGLPFF